MFLNLTFRIQNLKFPNHLLSEYFSSANRYSLFQTRRLKVTTISDITTTLAASTGKFAAEAASLIWDPRPKAVSVLPLSVTYSATMLAFQVPPADVTMPVMR